MRWLTFILFAYIFLALQTGLATLWHWGDVNPSLMLILMVYIGLCADGPKAMWAALILGLLVDLMAPGYGVVGTVGDMNLIGPMALGYLAGAYCCLQLRGIVFRDSPITMAAVVFIVGIFVHLVAVALLTFRGVPLPVISFLGGSPIPNWHPADELLRRFFQLVYSSLLALPFGWMLIRSAPLWGFDTGRGGGNRQPARRSN